MYLGQRSLMWNVLGATGSQSSAGQVARTRRIRRRLRETSATQLQVIFPGGANRGYSKAKGGYTSHTSSCMCAGCACSPRRDEPQTAFKSAPDRFTIRIINLSKIIGINEKHTVFHHRPAFGWTNPLPPNLSLLYRLPRVGFHFFQKAYNHYVLINTAYQ